MPYTNEGNYYPNGITYAEYVKLNDASCSCQVCKDHKTAIKKKLDAYQAKSLSKKKKDEIPDPHASTQTEPVAHAGGASQGNGSGPGSTSAFGVYATTGWAFPDLVSSEDDGQDLEQPPPQLKKPKSVIDMLNQTPSDMQKSLAALNDLAMKSKKKKVMAGAPMSEGILVDDACNYAEINGRRYHIKRAKIAPEMVKGMTLTSCQCCGCKIYMSIDSNKISSVVSSAIHLGGCLCLSCTRRAVFDKIRQFSDENGNGYIKHHRKWGISDPSKAVGRTIGIEVECNPGFMSVVRAIESRFCNIKGDHSLRGRSVEFTSPILDESTLRPWLKEFKEKIKAHVYSRCGLHIWIGAPDFSWWDNLRMWKYCKMHEAIFFKMVSKSRRPKDQDDKSGRPLCLPDPSLYNIRNKSELLFVLYGNKGERTGLMYDKGMSKMMRSKRANDTDKSDKYIGGVVHRYHWFNMHGFWHRRAFEIRLHQGTTNRRKIAMWIRLWIDIANHISSGGSLHANPLMVTSPLVGKYWQDRMVQLEKC